MFICGFFNSSAKSLSDKYFISSSLKILNIFERFYRIDKARTSNVAGTGLGLSIVKETVDICGGKIEVTSSENEGSEFVFTLLK